MISFWKFDFQIRLQIKRNVARVNNKAEFSDRDVDDAPDGYVACESYKDTHTWEHVANMERAMQVIWRKIGNFVIFSHLRTFAIFENRQFLFWLKAALKRNWNILKMCTPNMNLESLAVTKWLPFGSPMKWKSSWTRPKMCKYLFYFFVKKLVSIFFIIVWKR